MMPGVVSNASIKLYQGVLFHNRREVDTSTIQGNFTRKQDTRTAHLLIRLALKPERDHSGELVLAVADTGIGVPKDT